MSHWQDQEVRNEARSRDRNERIGDVRGSMGTRSRPRHTCVSAATWPAPSHIKLTRSEYEAVRGYSTRFAIATDHENPEIDQLVSEGSRFSVVQKIAGRPARVARQTDHRRTQVLGS